MIARRCLALLTLSLIALAGCGDNGESDEAQIREVAEQSIEAARTGDYAKTCELYGLSADQCAPSKGDGISKGAFQQGLKATEQLAKSMKVEKITVKGDKATVKMSDSEGISDLPFEKKDGKWRPALNQVYDRVE